MARPTATPLATAHPMALWLRARVLALRASTMCRRFDGVVELVDVHAPPGTPPAAAWTYGREASDHALRVDVLVRLLTRCAARDSAGRFGGPLGLVHVRPGRHEPTDLDLGWAAASRVAAAVCRSDMAAVVALSRWGWHDLGTGTVRTWVRLRSR